MTEQIANSPNSAEDTNQQVSQLNDNSPNNAKDTKQQVSQLNDNQNDIADDSANSTQDNDSSNYADENQQTMCGEKTIDLEHSRMSIQPPSLINTQNNPIRQDEDQ